APRHVHHFFPCSRGRRITVPGQQVLAVIQKPGIDIYREREALSAVNPGRGGSRGKGIRTGEGVGLVGGGIEWGQPARSGELRDPGYVHEKDVRTRLTRLQGGRESLPPLIGIGRLAQQFHLYARGRGEIRRRFFPGRQFGGNPSYGENEGIIRAAAAASGQCPEAKSCGDGTQERLPDPSFYSSRPDRDRRLLPHGL